MEVSKPQFGAESEPDQSEGISRSSGGPVERAVFLLGIVISLAHVYFNTLGTLSTLWQNALHFAGFAILCTLLFPPSASSIKVRQRLVLGLDIAFGMAVSMSAIYLMAAEDAIYARGVRLALADWVCGIIVILGAIELTRRTTGLVIPILIVLALSYVTWLGSLISGVFQFGGLSAETILFRSIYGDDGLFGSIARISSTFVFMFILFGAFLLRSGAGEFIIDFARSLAGRLIGGPGLVAVMASGLTGTISGSAVANTASTGVITIPLMRRSGFSGKFAAGVEAAASTGGQLMPPIMGAGAFVMATYTQIPYTHIVAVSFLPAVMYFVTVAFFVRIEAKRRGIMPSSADAPRLGEVLRRGGLAFLLPISVLIGLLIYGFTPTYAAGISIVTVVVSSWLTPHRMGVKAILEALALGARNMVTTAILLVSVGLIVNVIATAGIGNTFSLMITEWAGGSLLIAIVLVGLASLVLGMGLPVTAAYIVLGTLSAPAIYSLILDAQMLDIVASGNLPEQAKAVFMLVAPDKAAALGTVMSTADAQALLDLVPDDFMPTLQDQILTPEALTLALLSAHMIIFWLSQDSNVTPPVCLTAFTAAAIAKTPPMATGLTAWKIAKGLYIVPLLFAYTPLLGGEIVEVVEVFAFGIIGLYAASAGLQGYLEAPVNGLLRVVLLVTATALLWPGSIWLHLVGAIVFMGVLVLNRRAGRFSPGRT